MTVEIVDHKIEGVLYTPSPNCSGKFAAPPTLLVVHDTAGSSASSSCDWLCDPNADASAHVVIGRDGSIVQLVPFDTIAWHAGQSSYHGRSSCNNFAIGIEYDNPGILDANGTAWFGTTYPDSVPFNTPEHGEGRALPYTEAQLTSGAELTAALRAAYPTLSDLQGHWYISPGRKYDTTPVFPLSEMRAVLLGRKDPVDDRGPWGVTNSDVNQRKWPSNNPNIIQVVPAGTEVDIIRSGYYADGFPYAQWHFCRDPVGIEGWIHSTYIDERY